MSVSVQDVRDAVEGALTGAFQSVPVYSEDIPPEANKPYFHMKEFQTVHRRIMGRRYVRTHSVDIRYAPSTTEPISESMTVAERLTEAMELLPTGSGPLRGTGMRHAMVDGALSFTFDIEVQMVKQIEPAPFMESAEMGERVK